MKTNNSELKINKQLLFESSTHRKPIRTTRSPRSENTMMTMMEPTTTIDLTETTTTTPPPTSIEEIHIETIEERLLFFKLVCLFYGYSYHSRVSLLCVGFSSCVCFVLRRKLFVFYFLYTKRWYEKIFYLRFDFETMTEWKAHAKKIYEGRNETKISRKTWWISHEKLVQFTCILHFKKVIYNECAQ